MTEWKECKLGELATEITVGFVGTMSDQYVNDGIPFLRSLNIAPYKIKYENLKFISENFHRVIKKSKVHPGDVVIVRTGNPGTALVIPPEFHEGNCSDLVIFRPSDKLDSDFICYYFNLKKEEYSSSHLVGAVQQHFNVGTVRSLPILLPPLAEQKAIAGVLSALDDKIDLLHRQNKTLEAMAEALFRQWFVEEAEESWEEGSILDLIELVGGGTPKTEVAEYWNGNIGWLSGGDITDNHKSFVIDSSKKISELGLNNSSAKILPENSLVISARGTVGKFCILSKPMTFSQSNYGIIPKNSKNYFFTYLLLNYAIEELKSSAYGSVFDTITTSTFRDLNVSIPPKDEITIFENSIVGNFIKMKANCFQIRSLEKLRDTLLPKLMSGEVRVNE
jgi:type I restriction enzyme S subunit